MINNKKPRDWLFLMYIDRKDFICYNKHKYSSNMIIKKILILKIL